MPLATATIGAANAGAGPALHPASFPLDPGGPAERGTLESLAERAHERGVGGARLFGHVAPAPPHAVEAAHAGAGVVALAAATLGFEAGVWALVTVAVSGAARAAGAPCLGWLLPRRPCWSLVLRRCGPGTRRLVVAPIDRARLAPRLPQLMVGALAVALLSLAGPLEARLLGAAALVAVGAVAAWLGRASRGEPEGPEMQAARALFRFAEHSADPATSVVLAGGTSAEGAGVAALLDWWGLRPEEVDVEIVEAPGRSVASAVSALAAAGWRVRALSLDELRSPP